MKKNVQKSFTIVGIFLFLLIGNFACKDKDDVIPIKSQEELENEIMDLKDPDKESVAILITNADNIKETEEGYEVEGGISAEIEGQGTFTIFSNGSFTIKVDTDGNIISISGTGIIEFPELGVFKNLLETFVWERIKGHIEYEKGSEYKVRYNTDFPLEDDRYYMHFRVFDSGDTEGFNLKHKANSIIFNFQDFYLDLNDPAIFFKSQLWKPGSLSGSGSNGSVARKLFEKLKTITGEIKEFKGAASVEMGISNHARFKSTAYEFSKPDRFVELYGYSGFDEQPSHFYMKIDGLDIPSTVVLQFYGTKYVHAPLSQLGPSSEDDVRNSFLNWINEVEIGSVGRTINGSVDFGGKGIGTVLGLLPNVNTILGYDVFNNDFNMDLLGAVYQDQFDGLTGDSYMRFGGEFRKPILLDILGENISKFIPSQPVPTGYMYMNIENDLDAWSLYIESSADIIIPVIGKYEFNNGYFMLSKDGITTKGEISLPTYNDIFEFNRTYTGTLSPEKLEIESSYDKNINLPNGIQIISRELTTKVSTETGLSLYGKIGLPFGVSEVEVSSQFGIDEVSFQGILNQGLDFGYGFTLPSQELEYSFSTDPTKGIYLSGLMEFPHFGYNVVEGEWNSPTDYYFAGEVNRELDFGGVNIPLSNGSILLTTSTIDISGMVSLPYGLKTTTVNGVVQEDVLSLNGMLASSIIIGGYSFNMSSSYLDLNTNTGVKLGGKLNLKSFTVSVDGSIKPDNTFLLNGQYKYSGKYLVAIINVSITQSGIGMSGVGTIYGLLGNELASGNLSFYPNWATGEIKICIGNVCQTI